MTLARFSGFGKVIREVRAVKKSDHDDRTCDRRPRTAIAQDSRSLSLSSKSPRAFEDHSSALEAEGDSTTVGSDDAAARFSANRA